MNKYVLHKHFLFRLILPALLLALPFFGLSQAVTITSPVSNKIYPLPDTTGLHSADEAKAAITTAESAGKALASDVAAEKASIAAAQTEYGRAETLRSNYSTALNNFNQNDVLPYKADLEKYNAKGKTYTDLLAKHNKSVQASNALPANQRKPADVAALNEEKLQLDMMGKSLAQWQAKLNTAKTKLDVKNAALQKQQQQYTAAEQGPVAKLRASKTKLTLLLTEMNKCADYAQKCHALLTGKFKEPATAYTGYLVSPEYKNAVSGVNLQLVALQMF